MPFVVGVGASAGGLEALSELVGEAPPEADIAYVIVQHLSPDYKTMIPELLTKRTDLRVVRAENAARLESGTVYVIESNTLLRMQAGRLMVETAPKRHGMHLPIDIFFNSMAADLGSQCAAVVLSGTGSDGTRGARAVKERGGFVVAQSPETSKFDGMPRSVIDTGIVDIVLPPGEIAAYLSDVVANGHERPRFAAGEQDDGLLNRILSIVRRRTDLDFAHYKPSTLARRIERRLQVLKLNDVRGYADRLERDPHEVATLHQELLIGVTQFFRDPESIAAIRPQFQRIVAGLDRPLRIWVAGCSTGEEAYTVAALAQESLDEANRDVGFKLFATDVNTRALQFAGIGHYPSSAVADIPANLLARYFDQTTTGSYRLRKSLRDNMLFSHHNVFADPPFSSLDMVVCRNVLIYLRPAVQQRVCRLFSFALRVGGVLWLGPSEAAPDKDNNFELLSSRWKIYELRERSNFHTIVADYDTTIEDKRFKTEVVNGLVRQAPQRTDLTEAVSSAGHGFTPPFLIVDEDLQLLFRSGTFQDILQVPQGRVTSDLRAMVPPELAFVLGTAVRKATLTDDDLVYRGLVHKTASGQYSFDLRARAIRAPGHRRLIALYLEGLAEPSEATTELALPTLSEDAKLRITELESELQMSSENLQATVEELESSNEELQATNEELLASNEELQSLNEELQSVNEELHTLNAEHHNKIEELSVINADLDNLLAHVDIGTLFLSGDLLVRRCNAKVADYVHVRPIDTNRPLMHFGHELGDAPLVEDCARTVRTREPVERLLEMVDGRRVLFRTTPLTPVTQEPGVVVTFTDVSNVHRVRESQGVLEPLFDRARLPVALLDEEGVVRYSNPALAQQYGRDALWVVGMDGRDLTDPADRGRLEVGWERVLGGEPWSALLMARRSDGERFVECVSLLPLQADAAGERTFVRYTTTVESPDLADVPVGYWIWDPDRDEFHATSGLFNAWGLAPDPEGRLPWSECERRVHLEDRSIFNEMRNKLNSEKRSKMSWRILSPRGEPKVASSLIRPFVVDETERRRVGGVTWLDH